MIAFFTDGSRPIVPLIKAYEELTSPSANLAAIPLFTLTGFLLAEGKSSERLLRALRALFGWAPGGTAVAAATLCAFFTLFTGGSGVTILALGGLLLPALLKEGYRERFSIGLLTASGSLGLLFPLSVPLILYGIVAQNVADRGSLHRRPAARPADAGTARRARRARGRSQRRERTRRSAFAKSAPACGKRSGRCCCRSSCCGRCSAAMRRRRSRRRSRRSMRSSCSGSFTAICRRSRTCVRVAGDCVALVGGVLVILSVAVGLTNYLVNAQVPTQLIEWTQAHIQSKCAVPARAQRLPAARRHGDGHLLGDRRRRAADAAAGGRLRDRLRAPRHHLHRQPRARLPASAARA